VRKKSGDPFVYGHQKAQSYHKFEHYFWGNLKLKKSRELLTLMRLKNPKAEAKILENPKEFAFNTKIPDFI